MSKVCVKDLAEKFKWEQVAGDASSLERPLVMPDTNRPGLELAGYFPDTQTERLVILGEKEIGYIEKEMDEVSQRRSFEFLTAKETPAIVICHGCQCPSTLIDIAQRKNFPVFKSNVNTAMVIVNVTNFLDEELAESIIIHGELMRIFGIGVLITGRSGMGKSEIALELIKRGHQLVADDRVDCYHIHNSLVGRTTKLLEGFMELRGVGVINISKMFGVGAYASEVEIQLHIVLEPFNDSMEYDRVGIEEKEYTEMFGERILKMRIPVSAGRPMGVIIESAVSNYMLMLAGSDSAKEFEDRVLNQIAKNKEAEEGDENDES